MIKGVEYHKVVWVKISIRGQWRLKEGALPRNGPSENAAEGFEWKYEEEGRVKNWVSTPSSQVAASLDLFARSRRSTHHNAAEHQCIAHTCVYMSSLRAIHDFHHSRQRILWKDQWWSHGRKHNCKGWEGCSKFSGVTSCPGLLVAPGRGGGETGHHGDTWGHKNLDFCTAPSMSVLMQVWTGCMLWFTWRCDSHTTIQPVYKWK